MWHHLFTTVEGPSGERHLLVPAHQVVRWDVDSARAALRDAASQDPHAAAALRDLAHELGFVGTDIDGAIDTVATAIGTGRIVAIEASEPIPRGTVPIFAAGKLAEDWSRTVPLSSLVDDTPVADGWVSIELVDHDGAPFADHELFIDHNGRRQRIVLDAAGRHTARSLAGPGPLLVEAPPRTVLATAARDAMRMDGFVRLPGDVPMPRRPVEPIALAQLQRHYRIVVAPPVAQPTVAFVGSLFVRGSSCPTAGVADLVTYAHESTSKDPLVKLGVFGHADILGDDTSNKLLSDRRSDVAYSLLAGDFDLFCAVAAEEQWGAAELQSLLRAIGCNPGAIDGEAGVLTMAAIREFRSNYNQGVFHRSPSRPRAHGPLPDGDELDEATRTAVLDAFHAYHSIALGAERFLGPARSGCGEFNRTGNAATDRRVSLAIYGADAPEAADFPCTRGDAGACDVDDRGALRCRFYRERIGLDETTPGITRFWDFEWLSTPTGKVHLSALTSLPDSNDVEISVQLISGGEHEDDAGEGALPSRGPEIGRVRGLIRSGVIYGIWAPPDGYDPFLWTDWFRGPGDAEGEPWQPGFRPPVFGVWSAGHWGLGAAPGHRGDRLRFDGEPDWPIVVMTNDGKIRLVPDAEALRSLGALHLNGLAMRRGK